jgi:hypothetical protein
MRATVILAVLLTIGISVGVAHAQPAPRDAIALLPFDGRKPDGKTPDTRLEIYGQPIAVEIARALGAADIEVVLVGAQNKVPDRVKLILGGTITGKGSSIVVTLSVRRNPTTLVFPDGKPSEDIEVIAPNLTAIDPAAKELSEKAVPAVRDKLAALRGAPTTPKPDNGITPVAPRKLPAIVVAIAADPGNAIQAEPLRAALGEQVPAWARRNRHEARPVDASTLAAKLAPKTVTSNGVERGMAFEVLAYSVDVADRIPLARARVRVRIADTSSVIFDRVVTTDTVVGERDMPPAKLVARVASEVLAIVRPHVRRTVATWP